MVGRHNIFGYMQCIFSSECGYSIKPLGVRLLTINVHEAT